MERSSTFKEAKANVVKLAKAESWNRTLTDRCLAAIDRNGQISNAHNVPEQIRAIISRNTPPVPE